MIESEAIKHQKTKHREIKKRITDQAKSIGFDSIGFAPITIPDRNKKRWREFLAEKSYGTMQWMATRTKHRESPEGLWPDVKSVLVLGLNYGPASDPMLKNSFHERANISVYAQNKDYHNLVKKRLKKLARWIIAQNFDSHADTEVKVFVDTAPVLEKAVAAQTKIGWQGKHTNIVSRDYGNWLFLGEIFTNLEVAADESEKDHCGSCTDCQTVCPTDAFPAPYKLDAKRCISYLTIEHQGMIDEEFRKPMGNRVYGCDDCLAVCPWNKFALTTKEADFWPRTELKGSELGRAESEGVKLKGPHPEGPRLIDFLDMDDASFRSFFTASPIKRIGRERFLRNVLIALGNSGNRSFVYKIKHILTDPSPVIRGTAIWALKCLMPLDEFERFKADYKKTEKDSTVLAELSAAKNP